VRSAPRLVPEEIALKTAERTRKPEPRLILLSRSFTAATGIGFGFRAFWRRSSLAGGHDLPDLPTSLGAPPRLS
jgi:hypothetical protein